MTEEIQDPETAANTGGATDTVPGIAPPPSRISVSALQATLRKLFKDYPPNQAVSRSLAEIGDYLDGVYMVLHAGFGTRLYSEEWCWEGLGVADALRENVSNTMVEVMSNERPRCVRLGQGDDMAPATVTAPVFDDTHEVVGAAAVVVGPCDREKAFDVLASFEAIVGYLTLLASEDNLQQFVPEDEDGLGLVLPKDAERAAHDPLYLAYAMAARLKNRHSLDQVVIGFVRGSKVRVAAVCGLDEVRPSNPGVKLVTAAMEECLDRRQPIVFLGLLGVDDETTLSEDCRLHHQWSRAVGGDAVGSFPIVEDNVVIAVVSVRTAATDGLSENSIALYRKEMQPYSTLIPVSKLASRGLVSHAGQNVVSGLKRILGGETWKGRVWSAVTVVFLIWLLFGSLSYSFTVPCMVVPSAPRTVASPRDGVLEAVLVRPGDRVRKGDLLASFDTEDELLEEASYISDIRRLKAVIDQARADDRPGDAKIYSAQQESTEAQLALVRLRLQRSQVRALADGMILEGDLEKRVGSRFMIGETLFQMAHSTDVHVELRIPEGQVWEAREYQVATFVPTARPTERIFLDALTIYPSSQPADGKNVFIARSSSFAAPPNLTPGMEGVVHVEVGRRSVWWVVTHRITDWMRLRFWM